jgi:hypothetical protein
MSEMAVKQRLFEIPRRRRHRLLALAKSKKCASGEPGKQRRTEQSIPVGSCVGNRLRPALDVWASGIEPPSRSFSLKFLAEKTTR